MSYFQSFSKTNGCSEMLRIPLCINPFVKMTEICLETVGNSVPGQTSFNAFFFFFFFL